MLMPEKHVTLAESILGLAACLFEELRQERSVDQLYQRIQERWKAANLRGHHDFTSIQLAILLLYGLGLVKATTGGGVIRCDS